MELIKKLKGIKSAKKAKEFVLKNKADLIAEKMGMIKKNVVLDGSINFKKANKIALSIDSVDKSNIEFKENEGLVKFIASTYFWLDNHDDVHDKSVFKKTIKERATKVFHLLDHSFKLQSKIGDIVDLKEKKFKWKDLGVDKKGYTYVLVATSKIKKKYNEQIFDDYMAKEIDQHSVGMWYIGVELAIDSETDVKAKELFDAYVKKIGNPEKAIKNGYFFIIKEAGLKEISAVLEGSNELTPIINTESKKAIKNKKKKSKKQIKKEKELKAIKKFLKR